jgi:hypothetical protein
MVFLGHDLSLRVGRAVDILTSLLVDERKRSTLRYTRWHP